MRRSLQVVLVSAIGLTAAALPAHADHVDVHGTLIANLAATDNVFAVGDGGNREADMFIQVRPGVILAYETPRLIQELALEVEGLDYLRNSDARAFNTHAGYRLKWEPTARSTVNAAANGTTGQVTTLEDRGAADQAGVALLPPGNVDVRQADVGEAYRYQITPDTSFLEGVLARYSDANDHISQDVTSYDGGATLGLETTWHDNALGAEVGVDVLHLRRLGPTNGPPGFDREDKQVNPHLLGVWRHDLDKHWSTSLNGGLVMINPYGIDPFNPLDRSRTREYEPVVSGLVAYSDDWGRAVLTAGRAVSPNLFIGENTIADSVLAQAAIPLWFTHRRRSEPQYIGALSIGYSRTQLVDDDTSGELGTFGIYHGDVGVSYSPKPGIAYGARYEYFRQTADVTALAAFGAFSRSTIFATFSARWPATLTPGLPRTSQSVRADGADATAVGEEVVVPYDDASDKRGQGGGGNQGGTGTSGVSGSGTSNPPPVPSGGGGD